MKSIYSAEGKKLAGKLRSSRKKAGFSQADAARRLKRSQSYVSKVESGQVRVDVVQLREFARLYKIRTSKLLS